MGAVYEAEERATGRHLALKVLGHTIASPDLRKRFLREGRLAAAINHPNSVYIYGTDEIDETPVIAMELVAGGTLKDEVKRRGPLPVREAVHAILQILRGLEAAQLGGVLHRDISLQLFCCADGSIKFGDWASPISHPRACLLSDTASGMCSNAFVAAPNTPGRRARRATDIYSVGGTLYYLLTCKPLRSETSWQVVTAVLDQPPRPIREFRRTFRLVVQIIGRCLAKDRRAFC